MEDVHISLQQQQHALRTNIPCHSQQQQESKPLGSRARTQRPGSSTYTTTNNTHKCTRHTCPLNKMGSMPSMPIAQRVQCNLCSIQGPFKTHLLIDMGLQQSVYSTYTLSWGLPWTPWLCQPRTQLRGPYMVACKLRTDMSATTPVALLTRGNLAALEGIPQATKAATAYGGTTLNPKPSGAHNPKP